METSTLHQFNEGLSGLREAFHKTGRLDDSNTKLDEISKLLCLEVATVYDAKSGVPSLDSILKQHANSIGIIKSINSALVKVSRMDIFCNSQGESLLGANPRLSLPDSEDDIAKRMAKLIIDTFNGHLKSANNHNTFEMVNEAFGHFVRDNFRNNIEDAQYMTPSEVVGFMCQLALDEINSQRKRSGGRNITVCDPSCGVGSFLAQFYKLYLHSNLFLKKELVLVGQDKVDRMARLAKLNLLLFGNKKAHIERGNSLLPESVLDKFNGKCDIILTNPPFGARFHTAELSSHSAGYFPCLHSLIQSTSSNIDSELLFVDRYMNLLRPGGSVFAVVPDAIISASGIFKEMREFLIKNGTIVSITELPAVTFAQAGTRTKTCVIHFRKDKPHPKARVHLSCAKSLGFEVASRKGVPYKRYEGRDDLISILEAMRSNRKIKDNQKNAIHSIEPSCVSILHENMNAEPWTPNHHSASRYATLAKLNEKKLTGGFELLRLRDVVSLSNEHARSSKATSETKCISVLHVGDFGSLNIRELMNYNPKYPGQPCRPGDILFSKINPRIPRALVVPDLGFPLSCSTEFEVMRVKSSFSAYEIVILLLSSYAQSQIQSLTSGTSSSHNRIKTEQLLDILLPFPKGRKARNSSYEALVSKFKEAHLSLIRSSSHLHESWKDMDSKLSA